MAVAITDDRQLAVRVVRQFRDRGRCQALRCVIESLDRSSKRLDFSVRPTKLGNRVLGWHVCARCFEDN